MKLQKFLTLPTRKRSLSFFILPLLMVAGCSEESFLQFTDRDMRNALFPLADGSYWHYGDLTDDVDTTLSVSEFGWRTYVPGSMFLPSHIFRREFRSYYPDLYRLTDDPIPAPVWMLSDDGDYDMGYMVNDTGVFCGMETLFQGRPAPLLLDLTEGYIPLTPKPGHAYQGLQDCIYEGTRSVETPAYAGTAHYFSRITPEDPADTISYWFADGVGLVKYEVRSSLYFPERNRSIVLKEYRIGEE